MTFFHVVKVHSIDDGSGGRGTDFPDSAAQSMASAEWGDSKALAFACVTDELYV